MPSPRRRPAVTDQVNSNLSSASAATDAWRVTSLPVGQLAADVAMFVAGQGRVIDEFDALIEGQGGREQ